MSQSIRIATLVTLGFAAACAPMNPAPRSAKPPTAAFVRIADGRMTPSQVEIPSGGTVTFVNADGRQHQIYSSNCSELQTTVLEPGESSKAVVGTGPKLCSLQDLLAPAEMELWGKVSVGAPPPSRVSEIWYNPGTDRR